MVFTRNWLTNQVCGQTEGPISVFLTNCINHPELVNRKKTRLFLIFEKFWGKKEKHLPWKYFHLSSECLKYLLLYSFAAKDPWNYFWEITFMVIFLGYLVLTSKFQFKRNELHLFKTWYFFYEYFHSYQNNNKKNISITFLANIFFPVFTFFT